MRQAIIPGLVLYCITSGLGIFLLPNPTAWMLPLWLTGYVCLVLIISYASFFSDDHQNFFPFIVLGIILLNFFIQLTGGVHSSLWPVYFLFAVLIAAYSPIWQTYTASILILCIEAANLFFSNQWSVGKWPVYAGFSMSLFGLSVAIAHIMRHTRREATQARDAHDRLIAHADSLDPFADTHSLESLAGRQTSAVNAARERESTFMGLIDMISRFIPAHSYALFLKERRDQGELFVLRAVKTESPHAAALIGTELDRLVDKTYIDVCAEQQQRQYQSDIAGLGTPLSKLGYYRQDVRNLSIRSFLAIPVIQNDRTIGVIAVDSLEPGAFSLEDQDTLGYFEPFFIQIIEKIQMALNLKTRADHFGALHEISADLNNSIRFNEIMEMVVPKIKKLVPHDFSACVLREDSEGAPCLRLAALQGYDMKLRDRSFPLEESAIFAFMFKHWKESGIMSYYTGDFGDRGRDIGLFPFKELQKPIKSLYGRLLVAKDECLGAFFVASLRPEAFTEYHRTSLLDTLINQISMSAYNSLLFLRIEDLARTDGLTGLLNHRTFMGKLAEEYNRLDREPRPFSILLMDIDRFKNINDTYGHPVGDLAIKAVAKVLMDTVRSSDFVARYGGEEFAVGMVDTDIKGASLMAERVRKIMEKTVAARAGGIDLFITLSIGVSNFPEDTKDKTMMVTLADNALYAAKKSGRNRVCLHRDVKAAELSEVKPRE